MVSSTSAFLLAVVERQRLATAACRLERHAVRPRACRNIVSYPHLRKERSLASSWRGAWVAAVTGLELTSSKMDFGCQSLGEVRIKSGASAPL
jgi:hypothetical protein